MEFKGTKGSWYINRFCNVVTDNEEVAYMPSLTSESHKIANATLIASAPDLLEALQEFTKLVEDETIIIKENTDDDHANYIYNKAKQAIEKALTIK